MRIYGTYIITLWRLWYFNNFSFIDSKFLVTSGHDGYNEVTLSEIIDLSCSGYHRCPDWVDFPSDAYGATGGLLEHVPLICGGYTNYKYFDECYKVTANRVVLIGKMSSKRYGAANVVIDHSTLWVTGGYNWVTGAYKGDFLSSTEFIRLDGTIAMGNSGWRHLFCLTGCLSEGRKLVSH